MKQVAPAAVRTFIPRGMSVMVACPPGCVRGKVYFDSDALCIWLRDRQRPETLETLQRLLRCRVCEERPSELRIVTKLWTTKLALLPGMPAGGR